MISTHPAIDQLLICSPKRNVRVQSGWEGFFPYYAGYPENFARAVLSSANLPREAVVLDPWNGSGTTTYTASSLGLSSIGVDINPVMVIVARARLLPKSEADSLEPLAREIVRRTRIEKNPIENEQLCAWFTEDAACRIRALERSLAKHLLGALALTADGPNLDRMSGLAATFYVALFAVCRELTRRFRSSNPTWLRSAARHADRLDVSGPELHRRFLRTVESMARALAEVSHAGSAEQVFADIRCGDTTSAEVGKESVDLVLSSPPYCTRIDYTAATRLELALVSPLLRTGVADLSRQMLGTTRVPKIAPNPPEEWGRRCVEFLNAVRRHPSKASGGYYYKSHFDYFQKLDLSFEKIFRALKKGGVAVLVVQDSYYKDIHNDLPAIAADFAERRALSLHRREDFIVRRSMSGINQYSRVYKRGGAVESVLCLLKH